MGCGHRLGGRAHRRLSRRAGAETTTDQSQAIGNTVGIRGSPSDSLAAHDAAEHIDTMHADSMHVASKKVLKPLEILPQLTAPAPVGMLCAGLFLANVRGGVLIAGLRADWSREIRNASLSVIFLRSGLELDLAVRRL
jgi:hypothetical protein